MNETAIPNPIAIADAMLKRTGEILRERDAEQSGKPAATLTVRVAAYFANEAPVGAKPQYAQVAEEYRKFPDVFPLYFGPIEPSSVNDVPRLNEDRISALWCGMPGGHEGFYKEWGYLQFARAVEEEVRANILAATSANLVDGDPS